MPTRKRVLNQQEIKSEFMTGKMQKVLRNSIARAGWASELQ
jgi:hypothetical protein